MSGTGGVPTQPNTPIVLNGPLPPGFVPHTLTDANGVSTPIWQAGNLPAMGQPAPVIPPLSSSSGRYGNPLRDGGGESSGPPSMFPRSPAGSLRPLGGTPGSAWANLGGATPGTSTRDLPGGVGGGRPSSIYGPPASVGGGAGGYSPMPAAPMQMPAPPMQMPVPTVPDLDDENDNGFDMHTTLNTQMNAMTGASTLAPEKKKKKKKGR